MDRHRARTLLWEAWKVLPRTQKAAIAHEVMSGLIERVRQANAFDPRPQAKTADPMKWHRHRVMPLLWAALDGPRTGLKLRDPALGQLAAKTPDYVLERPAFIA
jgi:hypothetical protein